MTKNQFKDLVRQYLEARNHPCHDAVLIVLTNRVKESEYSDDKAYDLACMWIATQHTQGDDLVETKMRRIEEEKAKPRPKVVPKKGWW
jgi:hypothetical protein